MSLFTYSKQPLVGKSQTPKVNFTPSREAEQIWELGMQLGLSAQCLERIILEKLKQTEKSRPAITVVCKDFDLMYIL